MKEQKDNLMKLTQMKKIQSTIPAGKYLFKVNNRNTRKRGEICSELTIKTPECQRRRSHIVFINTYSPLIF